MLVFVVLEAHRLIIIERVRIIIDRLPFVVALGECDLLLRDIHFDSAGDSGVDFLLCGREDYIECLFASIADRGFCIVLIRPCERALNRLAVKGCRAAVQFEVEQLIAVGGAKIFQIECRLVLIRSRRSYNCLIFGHAVKLRSLLDLGFLLFPVDRNGQIARIKLVKRIVCCRVQRDGNAIGSAYFEVSCVIRISGGFRAFVAIVACRSFQISRHIRECKVTLSAALRKAFDGQRRVGDRSRNDGHNDLVGGCRLMVVIRRTDGPEGIGTDVQLCRCTVVYCTGTLVRCFIVDHDIRRITPADGDTVAVGEHDGVAVRNRNCVFLVVDLQRQLALGFCDLEGRRNRALIFALAGRGQRRGADIDVVRIGQIIIDAVFKELFAKRDSRGGLDLIAVIVFEGTDSCNGSTADVSGVHNQVIGCRSLTIICNGNRVAIVVRNSQNRTIFRFSCVAAGNHVRIAASECRGNFKSIQIQRLTAGIF